MTEGTTYARRTWHRAAPHPCHAEVAVVPLTLSARPPVETLTAAFARVTDARYAIGILESCGDGPIRATIEPVNDDRGVLQLVMLHIEIGGIPRERILSAIGGGHGVMVSAPEPASRAASVVRIA